MSFVSSSLLSIRYQQAQHLYFRGRYIVDAAFSEMAKRGLLEAKDVVIAGNSAGALAAQIHANYYRSKLPSHISMTGLADSGIFLDYDTDTVSTVANLNLDPDTIDQYHNPSNALAGRFSSQQQWVFMMQNATAGVSPQCLAFYQPKGLAWRCFFAQYNAGFLQVRRNT